MRVYLLLLTFLVLPILLLGQSSFHLSNGVNVTIEGSTVLTIKGNLLATDVGDTSSFSNNGVIEIEGDWGNTGSGKLVDLSEGLIEFNGTTTQEISGNTAFNNLRISNSGGVSIISGSTEINNELELNLGELTTNGFLTLNATVAKTARIAPILTGSISGDVTIEAFIENESYDYRFLSMPVRKKTLNEWLDDILLTGFIGSDYPSFSFINVYTYNETLIGSRNFRYLPAINITDSIKMGVGAQIYLGAADILVDVKGEIYSGTLDLPVTFTDDITQPDEEDGWNLIGNPYPSTIDWDSPHWTKAGLEDAIYIYEGSTGNYRTYINGVGANDGTSFIPSSQAFWVKAKSAPTLTITENVKTAEEIGYIENDPNQELLRLRLSDNSGKQDEIVVRYNQWASSAFDSNWDALKLRGNSVSLIAKQDSIEYSILSLNEDSMNQAIYLQIEVPTTGNYTINVDQLPNNAHCLFLEDLFTGRIESLRDSNSFSFHFSDTTRVPRFRLNASKVAKVKIDEGLCYGDSAQVKVVSLLSDKIQSSWFNTNLVTMQSDSSIKSKTYQLADGLYHFSANHASCATQNDTFLIASVDSIVVQTTISPDTGFSSGSAQLTISGGMGPYDVTWNGVSSPQGQSIYGLSAGIQKVEVMDVNNCIKKMNVFIPGVTTSLNELDKKLITVYPNPVVERVYFSGIEKRTSYSLYDLTGRLVLEGDVSPDKKELNINELNSGIYFLKLRLDDGDYTIKIEKINQ